MKTILNHYRHDRSGLTSIEYGLIVMAVALAAFTAYFLAGDAISEMITHTTSSLETVASRLDDQE